LKVSHKRLLQTLPAIGNVDDMIKNIALKNKSLLSIKRQGKLVHHEKISHIREV